MKRKVIYFDTNLGKVKVSVVRLDGIRNKFKFELMDAGSYEHVGSIDIFSHILNPNDMTSAHVESIIQDI